ncbi:MAG: HAD family hydrolase [Syntrophobacteraceae bacterium]
MLIALDLDDTLYLERDFVRSGFISVDNWLRERAGIAGFFEVSWDLFEAGTRGNTFDLALEKLQRHSHDLVQEMVQVYREHRPAIRLEPDALDFIRSFRPEDLALITDGHSLTQWSKIRALGLESLIGAIIVTGDKGQEFSKPHPWSFLTVQGARPPRECMYVGDNPLKDFNAPSLLGWSRSCRIRREGSLHFELQTPGDCLELGSFADVREALSRL